VDDDDDDDDDADDYWDETAAAAAAAADAGDRWRRSGYVRVVSGHYEQVSFEKLACSHLQMSRKPQRYQRLHVYIWRY